MSDTPTPLKSHNRLQTQFAMIAVSLLLATSVVFMGVVLGVYHRQSVDAHERASLSVNRLLQASLENAMLNRDLPGLQHITERLGAQDDIDQVMIVNPAGMVRFSSDPTLVDTLLDDPAFGIALNSRSQQTHLRAQGDGRQVLRSLNPVQNRAPCQQCHGPVAEHPVNGVLVVDYNASALDSGWRSGIVVLAGLGLVVIAVTVIGLWIALRRIVLGRINTLENVTTRMASGDLTARTPAVMEPGKGDEIDHLSSSFDLMASRLEQSVSDARAAQRFLQDLVDSIPDGIRVIAPDFSVVLANRAFCEQVGHSSDEILSMPCYQSSHGRDSPCIPTLVECPLVEVLQNARPHLKCTHVHKRTDGRDLAAEVYAVATELTRNGTVQRCVVESVRDLETQMNISQEQRLAELSMLAAGVAHEVHNPLSSISVALRALGDEERMSETGARYIQIAETEIANCLTATDSLLRLSLRPQPGYELVDLNVPISETLLLMAHEAQIRGVELHFEPTTPVRVRSRDSDARVLVFNLVLNAIHAMPDGGRVDVTLRRETETIVLEISDTGVGIDPANLDRILLPFWTARADKSRGRGLGLAICKNILDDLGAALAFESALGQGTTVRVTFADADAGDRADGRATQ